LAYAYQIPDARLALLLAPGPDSALIEHVFARAVITQIHPDKAFHSWIVIFFSYVAAAMAILIL
jgi:hypothetical protein